MTSVIGQLPAKRPESELLGPAITRQKKILSILTNRSYVRLLFGAVLGLLTYMSLHPSPPDMPDGLQLDKWAHLSAYFVLAYLIDASFPRREFGYPKWAFLLVYGLLIEALQTLVPGRTFSLVDLLANMAGVGVYVLLIRRKLGPGFLH